MEEIIINHLKGQLTVQEKMILDEWLAKSERNRRLFDRLNEQNLMSAELEKLDNYDAEKGWIKLEELFHINETPVIQMRKKQSWRRIAVAASILLIIGLGSYFMFFNRPVKNVDIANTQQERYKNDIDPGKYKAKLTLADGRIIVLDSVLVGELATQGGTVVLNKNGQLVYQAGVNGNEILYNTLTTAKGETYATVLADGSKVWLNSGSSIKFPVAFVNSERKVEITGEAYFEIAKDATKPFTVSTNGMQVQVLGTHFNINAYGDETVIKTTLLEGSVKVTKADKDVIIKPGQQAQVDASGQVSVVGNVDVDEVMAWRNGLFKFNDVTIEPIMRQIERWYDVDVVFEGKVTEHFITTIPRDVPVSQVFKYLETTGRVHFKIEGRKVTVMP